MKSLGFNEQQLQKMKTHPGFIAALDQSGGSTPGALKSYGIKENAWSNDDEMFAIVHQMRTRTNSPRIMTEKDLRYGQGYRRLSGCGQVSVGQRSEVGRRMKMSNRDPGRTPTLLIWAFLLFIPFNAFADSPTVEIKSTVDQAIQILTDPQLRGEGKKQERRKKLREAIFVRFDFQEMAQRSLGAHWQRRTPEEQTEFIKVFSDLLEQTYVDKIESYNNEKFIYLNQRIDEPYAEVGSKIQTSKGEEFTINYKLHRVGADWRVYDVVIENVSLVNNYRSQFNRILTGSTYDELISKIKAKVSDKRDQMK